MTNLTLEQYRSAVMDELDRLEFLSIFNKVEQITTQQPIELTHITAAMIDRYFELGVSPKTTADSLFTAATFAFAEVFGNLTKN